MTLSEIASRYESSSLPSTVQFGPFRFDRAELTLSRDGEEVRLPPRVLGVLQLLIEREGKVVSKQELIETVWGGAIVTDTSLTEAISVLRQALGDDPQDPTFLQTLHRRGYRFIAPVAPVIERTALPVAIAIAEAVQPEPQTSRVPWMIAAAALVLIAIGAAIALWPRTKPASTHVAIAPADKLLPWSSVALSPNGRTVVYAAEHDGRPHLFVRSLNSFEPRLLAGTRNGHQPFFSPDGEWIGFFAGTHLSKVRLSGGAPLEICRTTGSNGATWTPDGWIIFGAQARGLRRVRASGGEPEQLTVPDPLAGEVSHVAPQILPDGKSVLFTIFSNTVHTAKIAVYSLETRRRHIVMPGAAGARFVSPGYLVYAARDAVRVSRFDLRAGRVEGEPFAVLPDVLTNPFNGVPYFDVSSDGSIVFFSGTQETPPREIVRRDASGTITPYPLPPRYYRNLEAAPDGRRAAVTILEGERSDVWVADLETGTLNRLTFDGFNIEPVWSPDGEWVYYASNRDGPYNIHRRRADGSGTAEVVRRARHHVYPMDWAPDGKTLVATEVNPSGGFDFTLFERAGERLNSRTFLRSSGVVYGGEVSPDGRWITYMSHEGSDWNIFVQDFPAGRSKWQISTDGGYQSFWSVDGKTLYYGDGDGLVAVPLTFVDGGLRRGRETKIPTESVEHARPGPLPNELTFIRGAKAKQGQRELRMILGWAKQFER